MSRPVQTSIEIPLPITAVWEELTAIEHHVEWMADAVAIDFHTEQRRGVGTSFSCATKIGPLRTSDEMVVESWDERRAIGVTHRGAVKGTGIFKLTELGAQATRVTWIAADFPLVVGIQRRRLRGPTPLRLDLAQEPRAAPRPARGPMTAFGRDRGPGHPARPRWSR